MIHLAFAMCRGAGCVDTVLAASRYKKYNFWSPGTVRCLTEPLDHGNVEGGARVARSWRMERGKQKGPPVWVALLTVLVPLTGIELVTFALRMRCSTD